MTSQPFFQNTFILRRPGVANFPDIIKVATIFIKTTFKDSNIVQRIRNYMLFSDEKMLKSRGVSGDLYIFFLLQVKYNCGKFHNCVICVTDFKVGGTFCLPSIREHSRKGSSWIALHICTFYN